MFILPSGHLPHTATRMAFGVNPCMGRQRTEQLLSHYLRLKTIIRLNGIRNHDITDAHIDFYARCIILLLLTDRHMTPINWQTVALHDLSPQTLYRLLALRSAVFVVEQTCCYLDPDGADLTALHVWAEQDGEIMACCRILPPENSTAPAAIGRVVINP